MRIADDVHRDLTASHYTRVIDQLTESLREWHAVVGLGVFGAVSDPGISDLDVLIVTRCGHAAAVRQRVRRWIAQDDGARYLFPHLPLVVSEAMVPALGLLLPLRGLRWVFRLDTCPLPVPLNTEHAEYLHLVYASFWLPGAVKLLGDRTVRLRPALLLLKSLDATSEQLARTVGCSEPRPRCEIRAAVLQSLPGDPETGRSFCKEYRRAVDDLCRLVDVVGQRECAKPTGVMVGLPRWLPRRDTAIIVPATATSFTRHMGYVILRVHAGFFSRLIGPWYGRTRDPVAEQYRAAYEAVARLAAAERVANELVSPFGFPFGCAGWTTRARISAWQAILRGKQLANAAASALRRANPSNEPPA